MREFLKMPTQKSLKRRIEYAEREQERKQRCAEVAAYDASSADEVMFDAAQNKIVIVRAAQ